LRTFLVRRWVDKETFEKLLTFSRYLSRDENGSYFAFDPVRAKKNGVKASEILELLRDLDVEIDSELEEEIRQNSAPEYDVEVYWDKGNLVIRPFVYLYDRVPELKELVKYDKSSHVFLSKPVNYYKIMKAFEDKGISVLNRVGLGKEIDVKFTGQLRDYQREAIEKWKANNFRGVVSLPTGAGKTVVGVGAFTEVRTPTLIVAFTQEQVNQWREALLKFTSISPSEVGLFYSEEKRIKHVTITTYQTAFRYVNELGDKFDLLIIDEVHHLPAEKFRAIAEGLIAPKRLGLSATPYREDGLHVQLFELMGGLVYSKSFEELSSQGYLAQYKVIPVPVKLLPEEETKVKSLLSAYKKLAGNRTVKELIEAMKNGDENAKNALKFLAEARKIINLSRAKVLKVKEIVEENKGKKIIVFTQYVEQAEAIAREVKGLLLTGKMSKTERERVLKTFRALQSGVLVVTTVGDEGLDIPDAEVGIFVGGTSSRRQFIQRLGRLLRPKDGKVAVMYELIARGTPEEYQAKKRKSVDLNDLI